MANTAHEQHSPHEHEFWERRFDVVVDPVPGEAVPEHEAPRGTAGASPASGGPVPRTVPRPLAPEANTMWSRALEWLRDRRGDPRLGVVVLIAVAVVAGLIWYRIGLSGGDGAPAATRDRASASADAVGSADGEPSSSTGSAPESDARADGSGATVVVHVAGAVAQPGVVELPKTARVIDALEAVGGATPEGDVDRLNLAAAVLDGSRVYVPRRGEADPGVVAGTGAPGADPAAATPGGKLNLNTATQEQLEALPGIGPTYAQAILAERTRRNGFRSVNELREVRGIGEKRFADLEPLVTV